MRMFTKVYISVCLNIVRLNNSMMYRTHNKDVTFLLCSTAIFLFMSVSRYICNASDPGTHLILNTSGSTT